MKKKLYEEKGPYQYEPWCEQAADSIENGDVQGDLYYGYSYGPILINGEDASTFFKSNEVKELILRDISYPVKDGHASYSGLDEIIGTYSSLDFSDPDVQADLIKLGFDEDGIKSLANHQGDEDEEIETWIDYDIQIDESNAINDEDEDNDEYDYEDDNDMVDEYEKDEVEESSYFGKNPVCKDKRIGADDPSEDGAEATSEAVERQPDMFGAEDTVYKDGVEAQDFDNILDAVQKIAPKMGFVDGWDKGDYYVMKFEGENIDKKRFEDIKSQLIAKFGDGLKVQWGYHQYSPEQKSLFVAFIDRANFDDEELNEGIKDYLPRGGFMRDDEDDKSSHKTGAWFGQGTDEQIKMAKIIAKVKFAHGDRMGRVSSEDLKHFDEYKKEYDEIYGSDELDEGWKDNLKKAAGVAAVAGGLMVGTANAANMQDPYDDRAPHPEQSELFKDAAYVNQYEDKVIDKNGNEYTMNQWADLVAGENPFDDNDYPPEFIDDEENSEQINESQNLMEGTANFRMFDSPNLAFTDEEVEDNDLYNELISVRELPDWCEEKDTMLVESTLDDNFAIVAARGGYYEGMNIGVIRNDEFSEWAHHYYEEVDGVYYEYNSDEPITEEEMRKMFDEHVEEEYNKGVETLHYINEKWGGRFITVASRASNGETIYSEINEASDPSEVAEEPAQKPEGDTKGQDISKSPINDTEVDIDDIEVRNTAWEELDLSGIMSKIEAAEKESMLGGDTAENTNISLRTSSAKSTNAEMKPSENKKQEKSKEPEIDKTDQKERIEKAEKTKAEIHEGFENIINETERFWVGSKGDGHTYYTSDDYEDACQWAKKNVNKIHSTLVIGNGYTKWKEYTPRKFSNSELEKVNYETLYRLFNILYKSKGKNFINKNTDLKDVIKAVSEVGLEADIYYRLELNDERTDKKYAIALMKHWNELCAEKTKAEIHEGFEFKFINEAEGSDIISFEITNGDGFPCKVEVSNKSSGQFTADELKKVIERENPSIWFNDAEAKYWFMDFSFEKGGKTYWMSSDNIEGDMSKYELSIYDGNDYGNDDDDKKLNEAQITGQDSPSGIEFLKTLDDKGRYMFLSRMQSDCKYFLDGHEYNKFLWAGNVEDQIKYMKWLYNSFPKNKKPEWISMEEIEDYEKRMAGKGKEDHSRDEIDEQMLDEGVGSRGMIKAIEKAFDDGRYGRYGKWECGLGGYDTGYQVSYEHIPFFEIKEDDTVKFLSNNLMKRKTGYTPQDIIDILSEIGDYTMSSESYDEELDESVDSDIEIGSVVALSDRYQNRCGDVIGFDGKMYQIDIDGDGSTYDVLPKDIIEVIQEPILDESARLKELASKMVLREADESSVAKVKINSIEFKGKEGAQDDKNWVDGKTYSFDEFQKLVYEYDYAFQSQADNGGYDKLWYTADITVDYNGKQEHIGYDGRLDLGDGKYGLDSVSVAFMVKQGVAHNLGIEPNQVEILNPEVPYDSKAFTAKYGTHEENLDKFLADKASKIKTPKYSKDSDNITPEEIEVGDYFADNDSNSFYRVVRRSKASVWLEKVKSKVIKAPYKNNRGELEYSNDVYPTTEPDNEDRWSWFDTSKPFRLGGYGHYVSASQGRHSLWFWGGKEIAESFAKKGKALMEDEEVLPEADQALENPFKEGDILCSSWGYGMTLVDFYKVIASSKSFVKLAHLVDYNASQDEYGQAGKKMPKIDQTEPDSNVDGRRFKVHIRDDGKAFVKINNYEWAEKWDGKPKSFNTYD